MSASYASAAKLLEQLQREDAALGIQALWRGAHGRTKAYLIQSESNSRSGSVSIPDIAKQDLTDNNLILEKTSDSSTMDRGAALYQVAPLGPINPEDEVIASISNEVHESDTKEGGGSPVAPVFEASTEPVEPDDDENEKPASQDIEESMRDVTASIQEKAASQKVDHGDLSARPVWEDNEERFQLPDGGDWPDLNRSDADVFGWVQKSGIVLTRMVTWNLMASPPPEERVTREFLIPLNRFHIYAIGTEECERTIAQSAINTNKDIWEQYLKDTLGPRYYPIRSHTLQAIHLMVFVHVSLLPLVSDIRSGAVATGLANRLGNKGGVGIRFTIGATRVLIVNAHLAAHQNAVKERNQQFRRIEVELSQLIDNQNGDNKAKLPDNNLSSSQTLTKGSEIDFRSVSDRCFFMGDLNYRIRGTRDMVDELIRKSMIEVMLNNDQMRWSIRQGLLPTYLTESEIKFKPTYKFNKDSDVYDTSKKRRTPGWTDRILFESTGVHCLHYGSVSNIRTSDHRPVFGNFGIDIDIAPDFTYPECDSAGNHGHKIEFTSNSQVCAIM